MKNLSEPATADTLTEDLHGLGITAGDIVMLHVSFKSVGPVAGGPDTLIDALERCISPGGGLVMFASWEQSTYDAFVSGDLDTHQRDDWPVFDPATAAVRRTHGGVVGAHLARRPGAFRSRNPDRSLLGTGAAVPLLHDQPFNHGFGPGSPLEALFERGAKTLNIGAPLYTATILHYAEYLADVPSKQYVRYEVPVVENGIKVWRPVEQMNRDAFVPDAAGLDPDYLEQVIRAYLDTGNHTEGPVGAARSYAFEMADLVPFAVRTFEATYGGTGS